MSRRTSRRQPARTTATPCPCALPATYQDCCGRLHRGVAQAATAEQLMRSRFAAFAVRNAEYLLRTWHPSTRPPDVELDPARRFTRLEILASSGGSAFHTEGTVEFRAHYTERGRAGELHETSRFVRQDGAWTYLDGIIGG